MRHYGTEIGRLFPEWRDAIVRADGLVVVTPEYNHGYPGSLRAVLDLLLKEYIHKAVAFVGVSADPGAGHASSRLACRWFVSSVLPLHLAISIFRRRIEVRRRTAICSTTRITKRVTGISRRAGMDGNDASNGGRENLSFKISLVGSYAIATTGSTVEPIRMAEYLSSFALHDEHHRTDQAGFAPPS